MKNKIIRTVDTQKENKKLKKALAVIALNHKNPVNIAMQALNNPTPNEVCVLAGWTLPRNWEQEK